MKKLRKILISASLLVLAAIVYLIPEPERSDTINSDPDTDFGYHILGEDLYISISSLAKSAKTPGLA